MTNSHSELTLEVLKKLAEPFPEDKIHIKPGVFSKDKTKAMWLSYLQHTDTAQRLDEVVVDWSFDVTDRWIDPDAKGDEQKCVQGSLTINGVTRVNVGNGSDWKDAFSDCLKRCSMLFGVGRWLYNQEQVWTVWNEKDMKYKKYMFSDIPMLKGQSAGGNGQNKSNDKEKGNPKTVFMKTMKKAKQDLYDLTGDDREYYALLDGYGYQKCNEVKTPQEFRKVFDAMESAVNKANE